MDEHDAAVEETIGASELELSEEQMRQLVDDAMERIVEFVRTLPQQPAADREGTIAMARSLIEPLPETGRPYIELLDLLFGEVGRKGLNTTGPGFLAYIPGGGLFHSAVADLIANSLNRYTSVWYEGPGFAQIEAVVIRWFCEIVGYPPEARGVLTTGASLANLGAVVAARHEKLPENFLSGTLYAGDQAHHSFQKAAMIAGFPLRNVREIPSDDKFRVRLDALADRIAEDRSAGLTPFMIVGSAGTTNTGAVDDLDGLADLAESEGLWLHLDAAYGGFFMLTERGRRVLTGIERADSMALDPHKGLFLPYGTGSLLVRDFEALRRAHSVAAAYMPPIQEDPDFVDFSEISPELTRSQRGLRVWLPVKMHGVDAFRRNLDEKLDLALWATDQLRGIDGLEIVAEPQLSLVAFRLVRPGLSEEELTQLNLEFLEAINRRERIFLSGTWLGDEFIQRICVLSFRTHMERLREGIEDIREAAQELLS